MKLSEFWDSQTLLVTTSEIRRNRLSTVARTLRRFRLVDSFGLGELAQRDRLPSRARIERLISDHTTLLPPGVTAKFIAGQILADLQAIEAAANSDHGELSKFVAALPKIPTGKKAATRYQTAMLNIFRLLFEDRLGRMKLEETIFSGIKRVDIRADNDRDEGFFARLRVNYEFFCPLIFFECKNYSEDPDNPAFDQLLGRLNRTSTQVGYILCRHIDDIQKARERCKQAYLREQGKKVLLWVTDTDVSEMADALSKSGLSAVDSLLKDRFEAVTLK